MGTDPGFGQPLFPGQAGVPGEPGFPGAPGLGPAFPGEPEFPGTLGFGPGFQTRPGFPVLPPPRRSGIRVRGLGGLILVVVLALIALVAFISIAARAPSVNPSGPCIDGPELGSVGQPVGNGNFRVRLLWWRLNHRASRGRGQLRRAGNRLYQAHRDRKRQNPVPIVAFGSPYRPLLSARAPPNLPHAYRPNLITAVTRQPVAAPR